MRLSDEQARQLQSYLMRNRPNISRSEQRQSRRIEGEIVDDDVDARGFRSVVVYIQRGLGDQAEVIRQVLRKVTAVQDQYCLEYPVYLFSFGWDDEELHHKGRNRMGGHNIDCGSWTQKLCDLASTDEPSSPASIPSLFPLADPYGPKHHVERDDLLIFFCRDQNVCMSAQVREQFEKRFIKHSIWIFCDDDRIDMSLGSFVPGKESTVTTATTKTDSGPISRPTRNRGLSKSFMEDLKSGILRPILDIVLADDTLSLNIRAGYINIYYRGGSLLRIKECNGSARRYEFHFDWKYVMENLAAAVGLPVPDRSRLPRSVSLGKDAAVWVRSIPVLKCAMDLWFGKHPKPERELQQLVERMNNGNHATDYFICDVEYTNTVCTELRADLIALYWPSKSASRKRLDSGRLAIIEMKHDDGALRGKSGIVEHIKRLDCAAIVFADLCEEMSVVFNQRVELGLIKCHTDSHKRPILEAINADSVDYIILLSDHDPDSQILLRELQGLSFMPSRINIRIAMATFMGYGLYEESIYHLGEFLARFPGQICSRSGNGDYGPIADRQDGVEDVSSGGCVHGNQTQPLGMCEICHIRQATEDRLDTWTVNRSAQDHCYLCNECSQKFMF